MKKTSKALALFLALVMVLGMLPGMALAEESGAGYLVSANLATVRVNEEVKVTLSMSSPVADVIGGMGDLEFDSSKLQYVSYSVKSSHFSENDFNLAADGKFRLLYEDPTQNGVTMEGDIVEVTFKALAETESTEVKYVPTELIDKNMADITMDTSKASVTLTLIPEVTGAVPYVGQESEGNYTIETVAQLAKLASVINSQETADSTLYSESTFTLLNDLDFAVTDSYDFNADGSIGEDETWTGGTSWTPIGRSWYPVYAFKGTFEGGWHKLSNLTISNFTAEMGKDSMGLFGTLKNATVRNLTIASGKLIAAENASWGVRGGALAAYVINSTIQNCFNNADVVAWNNVGGLLGEVYSASRIDSCGNSGSVTVKTSRTTGNHWAGGIAAAVHGDAKTAGSTTVSNCYNTGSVTTLPGQWRYTGGLIGQGNQGLKLENCFNAGLTVDTNGDICGTHFGDVDNPDNKDSRRVTFVNCYGLQSLEMKAAGYYNTAYDDSAFDGLTLTNEITAGKLGTGFAGEPYKTLPELAWKLVLDGRAITVADAAAGNTAALDIAAETDFALANVYSIAYDAAQGSYRAANVTESVTNNEITLTEAMIVDGKAYFSADYKLAPSVEGLIARINAIGTVTLESGEAIVLARTFYTALSEEDQTKVTNYETLLSAEAAYTDLLIADMTSLTIESKQQLTSARKYYDSLVQAAQDKVTKLDMLTDLEAAFATVKLIDAIGEIAVTSDCLKKINDAQASYDALTDAQKAYVGNYETLRDAMGAYETAGNVEISTAEEMLAFAQRVNAGETTLNAKLTKDIDLSTVCGPTGFTADGVYDGTSENAKRWVGIGAGDRKKVFEGTFDGQGHKISGVYIQAENPNAYNTYEGFFRYVYGATIKNLELEIVGGDFTGRSLGILVGATGAVGNFKPVYVENCTVRATGTLNMAHTSGAKVVCIVNATSLRDGSYVKNCKNYVDVTGANEVVGIAMSIQDVTDCVNYGNLTANRGYSPCAYGIGYSFDGTKRSTITSCANYGKISSPLDYSNGGSTALGIGSSASDSVIGCVNHGEVSAKYASGIGGATVSVIDCYNLGDVYTGSKGRAGGITQLLSGSSKLIGCYNAGDVYTTAEDCEAIGGIAGVYENDSSKRPTIENCWSSSDCSAKNVYGIVKNDMPDQKPNVINSGVYTKLKAFMLSTGFSPDTANMNNGLPVFVRDAAENGEGLIKVTGAAGDTVTLTGITLGENEVLASVLNLRYNQETQKWEGVQVLDAVKETDGAYTITLTEEMAAKDGSFLFAAESGDNETAVIGLIDAIGTVTTESGDKITAARSAYAALAESIKAKVTNYDKLVLAEKIFAVESLIAAIDNPVTLDSYDGIETAKNAYDALTDAEKELVVNADVLSNAEVTFVEELIADIGEVTASSRWYIEDARDAYDALTEAQQAQVSNYETLTTAEMTYAAKLVENNIKKIYPVKASSTIRQDIQNVREAYDALTDEQKALVSNYEDLVQAEKDVDSIFDPVAISNAEELLAFATRVNAGENMLSGYLTADIDMTDSGWTPIAQTTKDASAYAATFDGRGHSITNFVFSANKSGSGLFGYIGTTGVVRNVTIASGKLTGGTAFGAIAGANAGLIENCANHVEVSGSQSGVGGIAGANKNTGTIRNCANTGNVKINGYGTADCGGITGGGGTVENCYNTGSVGSPYCSGTYGIAGPLAVSVKNCYNTGVLSSWADSAYQISNTSVSKISNCYGLADNGPLTIDTPTDAQAKAVTADELKTLAGSLGEAFVADSAKAPINGGNPILLWQATPAGVDAKFDSDYHKKGETVTMQVVLTGAENVNAIGYSMSFDPDLMTLTSAEPAEGLELQRRVVDRNTGKLLHVLSVSEGGTITADENGTVVATMTFMMLKEGTPEISFTKVEDDVDFADRTVCVMSNGEYVYAAGTVSYGQSTLSDMEAAAAVDALIEAIGEVEENSGDAIQAARSAYEALTDAQKELVKKLGTLTDAEKAFAALGDAAAAAAVDAKIEAIGKVGAASGETIQAAREAYDALTEEQKALVTKLDALTAAEAQYDLWKKGDVNFDGRVNIQDLSLLLSAYGSENANCDINSDSVVNASDLSVLLANYGARV